jgi:hypothetical protein
MMGTKFAFSTSENLTKVRARAKRLLRIGKLGKDEYRVIARKLDEVEKVPPTLTFGTPKEAKAALEKARKMERIGLINKSELGNVERAVNAIVAERA